MSSRTKRLLFGIGLLVCICMAMLYYYDKNHVYRAIYYNFADIDDNRIFEEAEIPASPHPQPWPVAQDYNRKKLPEALDRKLKDLGTVGFLIIKNDSLRFEQYREGYSPASLTNSFSMAKSIVSMLVGIAIKEGKIQSVDQPAADFLPFFRKTPENRITIRHLLTMSSGLNWDESYSNPLSMTTEAYYGSDLLKTVSRLQAVEPPGQQFHYKSGDTQLLGFVLKAATGMSLSEYAYQKLWSKIGAEHKAEWSLDRKDGDEKAYCCFYSNTRDFARLGKLYLNNGIWNGDTLVPANYVKESLTPTGMPDALTGEKTNFYGYQWWLLPGYKGENIFYARGILGQYIIVVPGRNLIIVRLGEQRGEKAGFHYQEVYDMIDAAIAMYS